MGGGILGAVSNTDGVRDSPDTEEAVGWYARDTGEGALRVRCNGKLGFCAERLSVFLRGICEGKSVAFEVELRASPASRRKSTMPASAAFCLPISDGVMRAPSAAVVLFAPDICEVDSKERLLLKNRK